MVEVPLVLTVPDQTCNPLLPSLTLADRVHELTPPPETDDGVILVEVVFTARARRSPAC